MEKQNRTKNKLVNIWMDEDEKAEFSALAEAAGMTKAGAIRAGLRLLKAKVDA